VKSSVGTTPVKTALMQFASMDERCKAFENAAVMRVSSKMHVYIDHVRCLQEGDQHDQFFAQVFVGWALWMEQPYAERVRAAKALGELWISYSRPDDPDAVAFMVTSIVPDPKLGGFREFGSYNRDDGVWISPIGMTGTTCPHAPDPDLGGCSN
jgi:hypothetical protein